MNKPIYEQVEHKSRQCEAEDKCCSCFQIEFGMKYIAYLSFAGFLLVIVQTLQVFTFYNFFYGIISVLLLAPNVKASQIFIKWIKHDNSQTRESLPDAITFNLLSVIL